MEEYLTKSQIEEKLKPFKEDLGIDYYRLKSQIEQREKLKRGSYCARQMMNGLRKEGKGNENSF